MNVLIINKFLHPNGGSETYIFKLGQQLEAMGHQVQYFGMEHEGRCVGNRVESYTSDMDFHGGSKLQKLTYPLKTIYSAEARKKLRAVLEDFKPDVCHINNFNFQLTPSILLEIAAWRKKAKKHCAIVYTAHDPQLVCPNHMCVNHKSGSICEKCLGGHYLNCLKGKCIHGSTAKSAVGMVEAMYWKMRGVYKLFDTVICCSNFLKTKLDTYPALRDKTIALHNFIDDVPWEKPVKQDYVLYFGRYSKEKGIETLLQVCKELPEIPFVFAGAGPLEEQVNAVENIENKGFFSDREGLKNLIRGARFSIMPSEWYENCPFTVMESQQLGTPVLGADIGGIPELIDPEKTGWLFPSGDKESLKATLSRLWNDKEKTDSAAENCRHVQFDTLSVYTEKVLKLYAGEKI